MQGQDDAHLEEEQEHRVRNIEYGVPHDLHGRQLASSFGAGSALRVGATAAGGGAPRERRGEGMGDRGRAADTCGCVGSGCGGRRQVIRRAVVAVPDYDVLGRRRER